MAGQTEIYIKSLQERNDPPVDLPFLALLRRYLEPIDKRFGHFDFVADEIKELYAGYNIYQAQMSQSSTQNALYHATVALSRSVGALKPPLLSKIALKPAFLPSNFLLLCLLARTLGWKLPFDLQSFAHKNNHLLQIIIREYPTLEYELPSDVIGLALSYLINYEGGSFTDEERPTLEEIDRVFERETNKFLAFLAQDLTRRSEALLKEYVAKHTYPGEPTPHHVSEAKAHIYTIDEARDYAQKANLIEIYLQLVNYLATMDHIDLTCPKPSTQENSEPIMYTLASVNGIPPRHITTTTYPAILGKEAVLKKSREDAASLAAASVPLAAKQAAKLVTPEPQMNKAQAQATAAPTAAPAAAPAAATTTAAAPAAEPPAAENAATDIAETAAVANAATTADAAASAAAASATTNVAGTTNLAPNQATVANTTTTSAQNTSDVAASARPQSTATESTNAVTNPAHGQNTNAYANVQGANKEPVLNNGSKTTTPPTAMGNPSSAIGMVEAAPLGTPAATAAGFAAALPVNTRIASEGNSIAPIKPTPRISGISAL